MERNRDFVYLNRFIWDSAKNESNKRDHKGLSFEMASRVFLDPLLCTDYDYFHSVNEDREKHIGSIDGRFIATVITTDRDTNGGVLIRLISARQATSKEVKDYEQNAKRIQGY